MPSLVTFLGVPVGHGKSANVNRQETDSGVDALIRPNSGYTPAAASIEPKLHSIATQEPCIRM